MRRPWPAGGCGAMVKEIAFLLNGSIYYGGKVLKGRETIRVIT
jgi:hypothetical protein